jgi:alpha-beta hydrolase superfamily lysophospholipase
METKTTFTFTDPDGFEIFVYKWSPEPGLEPRAVVQVAHGAAEHALRYERFARFLNQHGFVVYADDHRGHGKTAGSLDKAGICGEDGWNGMLEDEKQLADLIKNDYPDLPLFFFGHSMGSMLAQGFMQRWGDEVEGVILSGTMGSLGDDMPGMLAMAQGMVAQFGADAPSELFGQMFASFNQPFEPGETGLEWLSCDQAEVRKYVDDPWCGFPFSDGMVLELFKGGIETWKPENEARIPKDLPLLVFSGALDPVGGNTLGVKALVERYRANGVEDISLKFYEGGRHEMLNETSRAEVHQDVLNWLEAQLA